MIMSCFFAQNRMLFYFYLCNVTLLGLQRLKINCRVPYQKWNMVPIWGLFFSNNMTAPTLQGLSSRLTLVCHVSALASASMCVSVLGLWAQLKSQRYEQCIWGRYIRHIELWVHYGQNWLSRGTFCAKWSQTCSITSWWPTQYLQDIQ